MTDDSSTVRVLMVCMGNICRYPMAEAVLRELVAGAGLEPRVEIDSAGTHSSHVGEPPDPRTLAELERHGIDASSQRARELHQGDLEAFDHVVVMDEANLQRARELATDEEQAARISLLLDHAPAGSPAAAEREVPDPWYEGGFDHVHRLVRAGCEGLLARIERDLRTAGTTPA